MIYTIQIKFMFHFKITGLFWLFTITSTTEWAAWKFYLLYWMPTPLEFGALMILPFYFAQVINSKGWKWHWGRWIQIVYSLVLVSLIIFQALWAVVEAIQNVCIVDSYVIQFHLSFFRTFFRVKKAMVIKQNLKATFSVASPHCAFSFSL